MKIEVKYRVTHDNVVFDFDSRYDAVQHIDWHGIDYNEVILERINICATDDCRNVGHPRADVYGIHTGHFCDKCYNSNDYPYRKDRYDDPDY